MGSKPQKPVIVAVSTALFRKPVQHPFRLEVLLVKRGKDPNKGLWALPGGSVEVGELLQKAAARELYEETTICPDFVDFTAHPVHIVSVPIPNTNSTYRIHVYGALLKSPSVQPVASDDAAEARFYDITCLSKLQVVSTLEKAVEDALHIIDTRC